MSIQRTLLVESKDDEHVLKHICGNRAVGQIDVFKQHGSVQNLLESIPVYLKAAGDREIVGIVVDADTDVAGRWDSLRDHMTNAGYEGVPRTPDLQGTIISPPRYKFLPKVGIWVMPDNQTPGILEDLMLFLIPPQSRLFDHVKKSVYSIHKEDRRFSVVAEPKALIHTWLAWQEEPGRPMGTAITARFLDPDAKQADVLVDWLRRLFEISDRSSSQLSSSNQG